MKKHTLLLPFAIILAGPALAQEVDGNWQGSCVAQSKPVADLGIHLHHGANTITTKRVSDGVVVSVPISGVHVTFASRTLHFQYISPNTSDHRVFDGQANNDFSAINGTLTQVGSSLRATCDLKFSS